MARGRQIGLDGRSRLPERRAAQHLVERGQPFGDLHHAGQPQRAQPICDRLPAQARRIGDRVDRRRDPPGRFRKTGPDAWSELTITEGRNRQVRRMTAAAGLPTLRLVRIAIGAHRLDGLAPGAWCECQPPRS
jgi:pseudouridine synthase